VLVQPHSTYDIDGICARARAVFDVHGRARSAHTHRL
jgi:hypothetical protein